MIYFVVCVLIGAILENAYPFIGKAKEWVKSKIK